MNATRLGVLCEEPLRGIRIDFNAMIPYPWIYSYKSQTCPTARKCFNAAQLASNPKLVEPFCLLELLTGSDSVNNILKLIEEKGGKILEEASIEFGTDTTIKGYISLEQSLQLFKELKEFGEKVEYSITFDHWAEIDGDLNDLNTRLGQTVNRIRKTKGLKEEIPKLEYYTSKY